MRPSRTIDVNSFLPKSHSLFPDKMPSVVEAAS
jgi:hypothetical protein